MIDVYLAKTTREKVEYEEALLKAVYELLKTEDEDVIQDVLFGEERESVGVVIYPVMYKDALVGKIKGEVFENGNFKVEVMNTL